MIFTQLEKNSLIKQLEGALESAKAMPVQINCTSCAYYSAGFCRVAEQQVPDEVKAIGCEAYLFDENSPPF